MVPQARIVFMGSPDFAVPVLEALANNTRAFIVVGVVTQPDRPAGRGQTLFPPPVKIAAAHLGIPLMQPEKLRAPQAMEILHSWQPDCIVVAAFGQILRQEVLDLPRYGCINVHASLLPRWRGAAPIQAAILAGDPETGITIMKMDAGIDTGPILARRAIPILPGETGGALFERLAPVGAELLLEILPEYLVGGLVPHPQQEEGATYAKMLKKEDGLLDFTRPAADLERRVRAFDPWPGTYLLYESSPLKVQKASVLAGNYAAGRRFIHAGIPAVGTPEGALLLDKVQPAGKKPTSGKDFLVGGRKWA